MMEIPDDLSFDDLHKGICMCFEFPDGGVHGFSTGHIDLITYFQNKSSMNLTIEDQEAEESEICAGNLLNAHELLYIYQVPENTWYVKIVRERRLSAPRDVIRLKELWGDIQIPSGRSSRGELELQESSSLQEINEHLKENPPVRYTSRNPDMDELAAAESSYIDEQMKRIGLRGSGESLFETLDKMYEGEPDIPKAPPMPKERGSAFQNAYEFREWVIDHPSTSVTMKLSERSIEEMLLRNLDPLGLFDFCKYLHLFECFEKTDAEKARAISKTYLKFPELVLYPGGDQDMDCLISLRESLKTGAAIEPSVELGYLCLIGAAVFHEKTRELEIAKDFPAILGKITDALLKSTREKIHAFDRGFHVLLMHYGVIRVTRVWDMMQKYFSLSLRDAECYRLIFWRWSLMNRARTFTIERFLHGTFVIRKELDAHEMVTQLSLYDTFMDYADISEYALNAWKEQGEYIWAYTGWSYLNAYLILNGGMSAEDARALCDELYHKVQNKPSLEDMMWELNADVGSNQLLGIRLRIWENCLHCILGVPLPGLKGGILSQSYMDPKLTFSHLSAYAGEHTVKENEISKDTHIEHMPEKLQSEVGSRLFTLEESDLPYLRKIRRAHPDNPDLSFLLGVAYQRLEHFEDAIQCFEWTDKLLEGKDESVRYYIDACRQHNTMTPPNILGR